jgi:D-alanyl-lipoteichoic acid acyltransferase DltB (MBOAT superfamily)
VTFFPQLIAGPIVQHRELMPQLVRPRGPDLPWGSIAAGVTLLSIGLFKKVILADTLSQWATPVFSAAGQGAHLTTADAWGGMLAYTFQLYFDFSGYSDIALGLARLFGFSLPLNFDSPYKATSISDLWNRWHVSLTKFLRDHVFRALGGSRIHHPWITSRNLMITMVLCGLWHGAGWTFVVFGAIHGLLLVFYHFWRLYVARRSPWKVPVPLAWMLTFGSFALTLVIFRADSMATAASIYGSMMNWHDAWQPAQFVGAHGWVLILGMFPIVLALPNAVRWTSGQVPRWQWRPSVIYALSTAAMLLVAVTRLASVSEFLYFQF